MPDQWEYLGRAFKVSVGYEDILNEKGSVGWELVCTIPHPDPLETIAVFKRPKGQTSNEATESQYHSCARGTSIGDGFMLRYYYHKRHPEDSYHFIRDHETGRGVVISFCPWCGEKL